MEYSLRALAGKSFHAVKFSAAEFSAPFASCTLCGKHIVENPADEEAAGGYVRLNVIEQAGDGSEYLQWDWVCEECLVRFRDLAGWKILPGLVDLGTHARFRRFKERVSAEREKTLRYRAPGLTWKWRGARKRSVQSRAPGGGSSPWTRQPDCFGETGGG